MSSLAAAASGNSVSIEESRAYCAQITRSEARNFYFGLKLLPEPKRSAMFALYAYMRLVDDIADGDDGKTLPERLEALIVWSVATDAAIAGNPAPGSHVIWPAFAEMVQRHNVPAFIFHEVIAGQRQDLEVPRFETFEDLSQYCYRVAGVVGLASIYVWGFEGGAETEKLAIERGLAFQLTNILRDLREDAERGRIYLPRAELTAAGIEPDDLLAGRSGHVFERLMHQQIARAQSYYDQSSPLDARISADSRPTLTAMTEIYHGLLKKIAADPRRVLHERISLSKLAKVRIAWRAARSK